LKWRGEWWIGRLVELQPIENQTSISTIITHVIINRQSKKFDFNVFALGGGSDLI